MSDAVRKAFAAWVEREMGPDDGIEWNDGPGLANAPRISQEGWTVSLEAEFDAFQAGYSLIDPMYEADLLSLRAEIATVTGSPIPQRKGMTPNANAIAHLGEWITKNEAERDRLRGLLGLFNGDICGAAHHAKSDQHAAFSKCPIEARIDAELSREMGDE